MSFLAPLGAAFLALALPIILLYMLRLRRREVAVSSTFLWEALLRDREANTPWQKLRRNLLLILQLLILLALTLALMRPALPASGGTARGAAVILDASASMSATDADGGRTRFGAALDEARTLISAIPSDETMTLILAGPVPRVLAAATSDRAVLRASLDEAQPAAAEADWISAFTLAAASLAGDPDARIIVISDGGLPSDLPVMPARVLFIPVGETGENLALSALSVRPFDDSPQLFASVMNYGENERDALLQVMVDGRIHDAREITLTPGEAYGLSLDDLPTDATLIEAEILPAGDDARDPFPLDDRAYAVYTGPASGEILLVTEGNFFLRQLLSLFPGLTLVQAQPGTLPDGGADLVVLDGTLPDPLPEQDLLIINPPESTSAFSVGESFTPGPVISQVGDPILTFVDFSVIAIREARLVTAESWARPLVLAEGGPLLLVGERDGQRIAILPFDIRDSDLPLRIEFPILLSNLFDFYAPAKLVDAPAILHPGDPVTLRLTPLVTQVRITSPEGQVIRLEGGGEASLTFTETAAPGFYEVEILEGLEVVERSAFAVNTFSSVESDITPRGSITIGEGSVQAGLADEEQGYFELWPFFAGLALLLLALEYWVYHRR